MKIMRNQFIGISVLAALALCPAGLRASDASESGLAAGRGRGFEIALEAGWMRPADPGFRELYGRSGFLPEIRISKGLGGGTSVWLAASGLTGSGTVPVLDEPVAARQTFFSLGAALERNLLGGLSGRAEAGLALVAYRESALGLVEKGTRAGFRMGAGLSYPLLRGLSATASAGYILSSRTRDGVSMRFGGFKAGIGLAYRFD